MSVILITHDLGVVASMCSRIMIMYGGQMMEVGTDDDIVNEGRHPYTWGLLNSVTNPEKEDHEPLVPIEGSPPDMLQPPAGCAFVDRCPHAMYLCKDYPPPTVQLSTTHFCRCWLEQKAVQSLKKED